MVPPPQPPSQILSAVVRRGKGRMFSYPKDLSIVLVSEQAITPSILIELSLVLITGCGEPCNIRVDSSYAFSRR